ncbi:hypothetical protein QQS21_011146 [Conoideocrella luteorostrata]|uniref:Deacetylase sirtuin-type domain-containing protein n=1 Tax=Conoideocrella luteorostrata TaxID=1105319 RepID=A0AAJ0CDN8_9HYPO|nr:hypothetical protein QQS21_011146 [Conoideocrella luteorostrata]
MLNMFIKSLVIFAAAVQASDSCPSGETTMAQVMQDVANIDTNVKILTGHVADYKGDLGGIGLQLKSFSAVQSALNDGVRDSGLLPARITLQDAFNLVEQVNSTLAIDNPIAIDTLIGKKEVYDRAGVSGAIAPALELLLDGHNKFSDNVLKRVPENTPKEVVELGKQVVDGISQALRKGINIIYSLHRSLVVDCAFKSLLGLRFHDVYATPGTSYRPPFIASQTFVFEITCSGYSGCLAQDPMRKPLMRIPYTDILAAPVIIPSSATTLQGGLSALLNFFQAPPPNSLPNATVVLTGAGLSVASGLADYRGVKGTYRVNKSYRPIYHYEFISNHEARKRYWARSFLGWSSLHKALPNAGHYALRDLGNLGLVRSVITQNVDSFHPKAHPQIPSIELHGYLRSTVCTSCRAEYPRDEFQQELARLNPRWAALLEQAIASGALNTENTEERRFKGLKANPDGDVDLPEAPYTTFRYPPCPKCLSDPPEIADGQRHIVQIDSDGAWATPSTAGILKPAVVMFGESIASQVKVAAENAIDNAGRLLVLGTSLATYSAWRLAKRAKDRGMPIAIVNMGGVRGEESFFVGLDSQQDGEQAVRVELTTDQLLPALVSQLRQNGTDCHQHEPTTGSPLTSSAVYKDMLS